MTPMLIWLVVGSAVGSIFGGAISGELIRALVIWVVFCGGLFLGATNNKRGEA